MHIVHLVFHTHSPLGPRGFIHLSTGFSTRFNRSPGSFRAGQFSRHNAFFLLRCTSGAPRLHIRPANFSTKKASAPADAQPVEKSFRQAAKLFETSKSFKKLSDSTRKGTLTVHLRAKGRRIAAVALRNALRGSLSHYPSLRILWLEDLLTVSSIRPGGCFSLFSIQPSSMERVA